MSSDTISSNLIKGIKQKKKKACNEYKQKYKDEVSSIIGHYKD